MSYKIKVKIEADGYRCLRCGYEWIPKSQKSDVEPTTCPRCKSPYWNRPRRADLPKEVTDAMQRHRKSVKE